MKNAPFRFLIVLFFLVNTFSAQQWVQKKYVYDSILNLPYGTAVNFLGGTDTLKLDLYLPRCNDPAQISKRPLLMWIHGGAFIAGNRNDASITRMCKEFAKRGYVTVSVSYRLGFVNDAATNSCNFPNYSCVFASDTAEWARAWYRGVQDVKGAVRFLTNRSAQYRIDANNVFIAGESAGAFISLGVALLDTVTERLPQTFALNNVANPNANTSSCQHNAGKSFSLVSIPRPDLGGIEGTIETSSANYTIKGIGNFYGGMLNNLLKQSKVGKPKPAIYSFHQPCDIVVPIDSGRVYAGLSWCMTNGYNCFGIARTPRIYGSRAFSGLNAANNYGYVIQNNFTTTNFPFSFLIGAGSCIDQVNKPCHAYDNVIQRENELANFFAPLVSTAPVCDHTFSITGLSMLSENSGFVLYPNPSKGEVTIESTSESNTKLIVYSAIGTKVHEQVIHQGKQNISLYDAPAGIYVFHFVNESGRQSFVRFIKE